MLVSAERDFALAAMNGYRCGGWFSVFISRTEEEEEDDPRVGGQWRIATLSRRGKWHNVRDHTRL
jgi:hypothetical protein